MQHVSSAANATAAAVKQPVRTKAAKPESLLSEPKSPAKAPGTGSHQARTATASNRPKVSALLHIRAWSEANNVQIASPLRTSTSSDDFVVIDVVDVRLAGMQGEMIQA